MTVRGVLLDAVALVRLTDRTRPRLARLHLLLVLRPGTGGGAGLLLLLPVAQAALRPGAAAVRLPGGPALPALPLPVLLLGLVGLAAAQAALLRSAAITSARLQHL